VKRQTPAAAKQRLIQAAKVKATERYVLRLYVTGATPQSTLAILNVKRVCEEHLQGRYDLEVIDIYQKPSLAKDERIVAAPTLIKHLPAPLRRLIGDLSTGERVLLGLDLKPRK
jgi:circadian clock protein KaiB